MKKVRVLILGAGPAGLAAAFRLSYREDVSVTVLEKNRDLGGLASGLQIAGIPVDYGSHRLHTACPETILEDFRKLLGKDLLCRPRHGRVRLRNRWICFPLKIPDFLLKLPLDFSLGFIRDLAMGLFKPNTPSNGLDSFSQVLTESLGATICNNFYFPYAKKLWGLDPYELSSMQARKRVAAKSIKKLLEKVVGPLSFKKRTLQNSFFYPAGGFGVLCEKIAHAARENGVRIITGAQLTSIDLEKTRIASIIYKEGAQQMIERPDYLFSTIPIPTLLRMVVPQPDQEIIEASAELHYRPIIFIYLVLGCSRFTEFDAHYFPEEGIKISRLSEPKNYRRANQPLNRTVICAELPCNETDPEWFMTDMALGNLISDCLKKTGLDVKPYLEHVETRRKRHAYPIYRRGYEFHLARTENWCMQLKNLVIFGRQGLFMHDNVHHAFAMGYAAADCIKQNGVFNREKWRHNRRVFDSFVVVD